MTTDFPRIPLLDAAEAWANKHGMAKPDGLHWGLRAVRAPSSSTPTGPATTSPASTPAEPPNPPATRQTRSTKA